MAISNFTIIGTPPSAILEARSEKQATTNKFIQEAYRIITFWTRPVSEKPLHPFYFRTL